MYRALYRKWRPLTFADVVGQTAITSALKNQIANDKIGHAYMLTGTRGTGKTTCAKIFAKAVNCLDKTGADPCGKCHICTGIDNGSILDVVEIDAASNSGVDNIRDLRDETAYTPSECTYKVYIIDEVHMLSTAAFNALLKIMEEPPSHIIFILATTEIHKVPATILSRCQRYDFTRISIEEICARIIYVAKEENISITQEAAALISRLADGALRDALSILDTCAGSSDEITEDVVRNMAGVADKSYLFSLSEAIFKYDAAAALVLIAQLREKSIDIKRLCEELIFHYRNICLAGVKNASNLISGVSEQDEKMYYDAAKQIDQAAAIRAVKRFGEALERMARGTDARIEIELAVFSLCEEVAPLQALAAAPVQYVQPTRSFVQSAQPFVQNEIVAPKSNDTPKKPAPPVQEFKETLQEPVLFEPWQQIIDVMEKTDGCLFVNMKNSKAYFDGNRVLIDASPLFTQYMRTNEYSKTLIKETIEKITGKRYGIGPYMQADKSQPLLQSTAQDALDALQAEGVEIIIKE